MAMAAVAGDRAAYPGPRDVDIAEDFRRARARRVRRAIPLAILMYFFQRNGGRDAFWIFFAAYLVLLTPGKNQKSQTVVRVGSAIFGVLLLAVASLIFPDRVLFSLGIVILFAGIGLSPPYPVFGGGLTTIAPSCSPARPTYLLWPRDDETDEPVPVTT
ncbi:MAG TPA: hypothetical protein VLZ09_01320 [Gaiellaceae bacterium]|nr:hypothetical protein [Gaiellaceae bacterium]